MRQTPYHPGLDYDYPGGTGLQGGARPPPPHRPYVGLTVCAPPPYLHPTYTTPNTRAVVAAPRVWASAIVEKCMRGVFLHFALRWRRYHHGDTLPSGRLIVRADHAPGRPDACGGPRTAGTLVEAVGARGGIVLGEGTPGAQLRCCRPVGSA